MACREATGLAEALSEAADMLLQYLEAQAEQPNGLEPEMCLAVARCLGRCPPSPCPYSLLCMGDQDIALMSWVAASQSASKEVGAGTGRSLTQGQQCCF